MSASHDPEHDAREASEIMLQLQAANIRYQQFSQRVGGRPEDVLLAFAMAKLETKIVKLGQ